jgi:hypothetical protein
VVAAKALSDRGSLAPWRRFSVFLSCRDRGEGAEEPCLRLAVSIPAHRPGKNPATATFADVQLRVPTRAHPGAWSAMSQRGPGGRWQSCTDSLTRLGSSGIETLLLDIPHPWRADDVLAIRTGVRDGAAVKGTSVPSI